MACDKKKFVHTFGLIRRRRRRRRRRRVSSKKKEQPKERSIKCQMSKTKKKKRGEKNP